MRNLALLPPFFLALEAALPAQALNLFAASGNSTSGTVCDPVTCTPSPIAALRGDLLEMIVQGAPLQPCFLLLAFPPAQCSAVPGIAGPLILTPPAQAFYLPLRWARVYVSAPPGARTCSGWMGFGSLPLPLGMPTGQVLMQAFSAVPMPSGPQLTLSNAVAVTVR